MSHEHWIKYRADELGKRWRKQQQAAKALAEQVIKGDRSPCKTCPNRPICAAEHIACFAFFKFVSGSGGTAFSPKNTMMPAGTWYRRAFDPEDKA